MAMTPKERQLVDELFDKLATLEGAPRDAEAERAIGDGLQRAPNALYPLVQTVLLQDEALKRSDARVRELESELGIEQAQPAQPEGFLDSMRDTLFGRREPQGSVPSVRRGAAAPSSGVWNTAPSQPGHAGPPPGYPPQEQASSGNSFLGTAAATAAGVIGGALLMNSLRGMFGGGQGQAHGALNPGQGGSPWAPPAGGGDLAREAGLNDIGGGRGVAQDDGSQRAGLFDVASNDASYD
jgi:hypothetical protein